jgi:hypothetical protein
MGLSLLTLYERHLALFAASLTQNLSPAAPKGVRKLMTIQILYAALHLPSASSPF